MEYIFYKIVVHKIDKNSIHFKQSYSFINPIINIPKLLFIYSIIKLNYPKLIQEIFDWLISLIEIKEMKILLLFIKEQFWHLLVK